MKHLVDDQLDDISVIITNSREDINLDVMNTNRKKSKSAIPIPLQSTSDPSQAINDKNKEEIEWKKTDNEDPERNIE